MAGVWLPAPQADACVCSMQPAGVSAPSVARLKRTTACDCCEATYTDLLSGLTVSPMGPFRPAVWLPAPQPVNPRFSKQPAAVSAPSAARLKRTTASSLKLATYTDLPSGLTATANAPPKPA